MTPSRKLPSDTSTQLRVGLFKILSDLKSNPKKMKSLNKSNLSSKHWKAIFELKKDASIVIKPADKGNKTLVYNQPDYIAKLDDRITLPLVKINV